MPSKEKREIAYGPVKASSDQHTKKVWSTTPDCWDGCVYTVCDSADDYNKIADHVDVPRTDCCTIYASRILWKCGGLCLLNDMGTSIKRRYEQRHDLEHQENPCWVCLCPEVLFRQVLREHELRHGTMAPAGGQQMMR
mmetsp:Transcript_9660/g.14217  ORF Transcript_9660/g.14217 Transcript_9660/m.14217 type:complete len:138 (-) Transcript_9660:104-517(-)|eukprot:CAMPEP_0194056034 /NCGR_PEP_ID=MMETSP0009_2-20130614/58796_1 /TAXON_ID=210454 /ORGANISM="Grammatophora oceanica, Strain CCMP 410" /LENGTH=137 /DNA_ID=CAMNT_0038705223 /DNA_START=29 /DNA_END=442 /DNA_ORIENTATION=-